MEVILSVLKSFAEAKSEDDAGYEKTYEWIIERLDLEELRENHEQLTIILELLKVCFIIYYLNDLTFNLMTLKKMN